MREIDFRHELILIFLKEKKYVYNTYDIMLSLSVNYETLRLLFEDLVSHEMITKDKELKKYVVTEEGLKILRKKYLDNFDLDAFLSIDYTNLTREKENQSVQDNILYIPQNFEN